MTIWAYYRVSTDMQDYNSQKVGVVEYCNRVGHKIDKEVVDDGVSGTVEAKKRNLWKIVKGAKKGDWLITPELSRLGRSTADVLNTCNILSKKGVNVWFVKQGMGLDQTPMGKMMVAILSAFSEMERDLISQRTVEGLKLARERGIKLGRRFSGSHNSLDENRSEVERLVIEGKTKSEISKILGVSWTMTHRFLIKIGLKDKVKKGKSGRIPTVKRYEEQIKQPVINRYGNVVIKQIYK